MANKSPNVKYAGRELASMEERYKERQMKIWGEWEEEQRKRWKDFMIKIDDERKAIDDELRKIANEWGDIEETTNRVMEDRKRISEEWSLINKELDRVEVGKKELGANTKLLAEGKIQVKGEWSKLHEERQKVDEDLKRAYEMKDEINRERLLHTDVKKKFDEDVKFIENEKSRLEEEWKILDEEKNKLIGKFEKAESEIKAAPIEDRWGEIEKIKSGLELEAPKKVDVKPSTIADDLVAIKREHSAVTKEKETIEKDFDPDMIINSLLNLVNERGEIEAGEAARILKVEKKEIKRWGGALDRAEMVKMKKSLLKGPVLEKL